MGRNRKWVLEDNLQEEVWRTIMRGPRPPSVRWEKRNPSAASSNTIQKHLKQPNVKASNTKAAKPQSQGSVPVKVPFHPDEVMAAARSRVAKLQTVLATLGEDDETFATIKAAFRKAKTQAQERPLSKQFKNTQLFFCSEAEASRGGSPEHHSGQGSIGESSHCTGKAGSTSYGRKEEVGRSSGKRENNAIPVHCSRTHGGSTRAGRVQPYARDNRWVAKRVGESLWCTASMFNFGGRRRRHGGKSSSQEIQSGTTNPIGPHIRCPENTSCDHGKPGFEFWRFLKLKLRSEC